MHFLIYDIYLILPDLQKEGCSHIATTLCSCEIFLSKHSFIYGISCLLIYRFQYMRIDVHRSREVGMSQSLLRYLWTDAL